MEQAEERVFKEPTSATDKDYILVACKYVVDSLKPKARTVDRTFYTSLGMLLGGIIYALATKFIH